MVNSVAIFFLRNIHLDKMAIVCGVIGIDLFAFTLFPVFYPPACANMQRISRRRKRWHA